MTLPQKAEQSITHRPNSYVPARTLERLISVRAASDAQLWGLNMAMHYGQGAVAGDVRAIMAWKGIRARSSISSLWVCDCSWIRAWGTGLVRGPRHGRGRWASRCLTLWRRRCLQW